MKQIILYLAAFLGNILNYSYSYLEHIKKKIYNNQLIQLRVIISLLLSLCVFYFHLGTEYSGGFSYFYFFSSIAFSLFTVAFFGFYFHRTDPNLNFSLKKYSFEKIKNKYILSSSTPSNFITEIKSTKPKTNKKNIFIHKQFNKLTSDLNKFSDFSREKKQFNIKKYGISNLQSFQILLEFFRKNYDIPQNTYNTNIYPFFNNYFQTEDQTLKCNNWTQFKVNHLEDIENNSFYNELSYNLKKQLKP